MNHIHAYKKRSFKALLVSIFFFSMTSLPLLSNSFYITPFPLFSHNLKNQVKKTVSFLKNHQQSCFQMLLALGIIIAIQKNRHTRVITQQINNSIEQEKKDILERQKNMDKTILQIHQNSIALHDQGMRILGLSDSITKTNEALILLNQKYVLTMQPAR